MLKLPNLTEIEYSGGNTKYMTLYESMRESIISHDLEPNEKLPSKRVLANQLGVSVKTIENAYEQLLLEGYIYSREKSGFFVSEIETYPWGKNRKQTGMDTRYYQTEYRVNLRANRNAKDDFPEDTWCRLLRETISMNRDKLFAPVPFNGLFVLRRAISNYLRSTRGMEVSPDCIIISAGTEYMYSRLIQVLGRKTTFALPDPSSKRLHELYDNNQINYTTVRATRWGFDQDELEKEKCDVLHISPAHQYPLGRVMPIQERMQLLQWANKSENRYIIEDDYDSEYVVAGRPIPPIYSIDTNDKVIYMNTFSKSVSAAVRISYMILPEKLMKRYLETMSFYSCTVASMEQLTLAKFIEGRYLERLIHRVARKNQKTRQLIICHMEQLQMEGRIRMESDCAGAMLLVRLLTEKRDSEIKHFLKSKSVITSMMSEYFSEERLRRKFERVMIVNYSGLTEVQIQYLCQVLRELTGTGSLMNCETKGHHYLIRAAVQEDLPHILDVYAYAREQMKKNGNPTQWGDNRPAEHLIREDIHLGYNYVIVNENRPSEIYGVFAFQIGEDETYRVIEGGEWPNEDTYGVIHRIAAAENSGGILKCALDFCSSRIENLRIDTHADNQIMHHLLEKYGFQKCGIIYVDDGTPRLAFARTGDIQSEKDKSS